MFDPGGQVPQQVGPVLRYANEKISGEKNAVDDSVLTGPSTRTDVCLYCGAYCAFLGSILIALIRWRSRSQY